MRGGAGRAHWQWHFANIFAFSRVLLPALSPEINFACTCDCSASRKQFPSPLPSPLLPSSSHLCSHRHAHALGSQEQVAWFPGHFCELLHPCQANQQLMLFISNTKQNTKHKTNTPNRQTKRKGLGGGGVKEGAQIKRERDRDKQPNATQSAAAVIDKFLLRCRVQ